MSDAESKSYKLPIKSYSTKHETMLNKPKDALRCQNVNDVLGIAKIARFRPER